MDLYSSTLNTNRPKKTTIIICLSTLFLQYNVSFDETDVLLLRYGEILSQYNILKHDHYANVELDRMISLMNGQKLQVKSPV